MTSWYLTEEGERAVLRCPLTWRYRWTDAPALTRLQRRGLMYAHGWAPTVGLGGIDASEVHSFIVRRYAADFNRRYSGAS